MERLKQFSDSVLTPANLGAIAAVGVVYYTIANAGIALITLPQTPLTLIWFPSGVGLAALLIFGPRILPAIAIASFSANAPSFYHSSDGNPLLDGVLAGTYSATIDSMQVYACYWVCRRFIGDDIFASVPKIAKFYGLAMFPPVLVTTFLLVGGHGWFGFLPLDPARPMAALLESWFAIMLADMHGIFMLVPLALSFRQAGLAGWDARRFAELTAVLGSVGVVIFVAMAHFGHIIYLVTPIFIWAAVRLGLRGLSIALFMFSLAMALGTVHGIGPFAVFESKVAFGTLFLMSCSMSFTFVAFSAAWNEIRRSQDVLEQRVTDRTAELEVARAEAEASNKTKSRFLMSASHDLRQPIHAMSLFATALANRVEGGDTGMLIGNILRSIESLGAMLNGLLDMSRLEEDTIVPQQAEFPIQRVLDQIEDEHRPAAAAKHLGLIVVPCSLVVRSDQALISRIVGNFVANAIRYTEQGRTLVGCRRLGNAVRLEVWDTGCGMAAGAEARIFEPHSRLALAQRQSNEGLGLGLAISKGLADLLGHPITVRSAEGAGSVFALELPLGDAARVIDAADRTKERFDQGFRGINILVVDDDADVLDGTRLLLEAWGCTVATARGTAEARHAVSGMQPQPHAIIADHYLTNGETGTAFLRGVREHLGWDALGIIISGDTHPDRRREIEAAGDFLLTKPIQPASLRVLLQRKLRR